MKKNIFTPYRICPLGAHVDHQLGLVTGFAIDKGVTLEYEPTLDGTVDLISANFSGHTVFNIYDNPTREMNQRKNQWFFTYWWFIIFRICNHHISNSIL